MEEQATKRARRQIGDEVVSQNGYTYVYVDLNGKPFRRLKHHVIAETKYGRPPRADERVVFEDNDRTNLDPDNILYMEKASPVSSLKRRRATLVDKVRECQAEIREIDAELQEHKNGNNSTSS